MSPYLFLLVAFAVSVGLLSTGLVSEAHAQSSQIDSVSIADNSFDQELIHLTGNYYVSSGFTLTNNVDPATTIEAQLVFRLYTIIDGDITLVASQNIGTPSNPSVLLSDTSIPSLHTSLVRLSDTRIAVAFDSGGSNNLVTYNVDTSSATPFTVANSIGILGVNARFFSLIKFDDRRLALAYTAAANQFPGQIRLFDLGASGDSLDRLTNGDRQLPSPNQYRYNSMEKIDDNTVAIGFRGGSAAASLLAIDINSDSTTTPGDILTYTSNPIRTSYHSLVRVDDDTLAVAYSVIGASGSTTGGAANIGLFDLNDRTVTHVNSQEYYDGGATRTVTEHAHFSSLVLLDSDTLAVAYRGADADGFILVYDIVGTGASASLVLDNTLTFEHDTSDGAFNELLRVDDNTVALMYSGDAPASIGSTTAIPSTIKTIQIGTPPAPTVTSVSATDGSYSTGETVPITVTFSGSVTVSGTPTLTLNTGTPAAVANYDSGSGTTELVFNYVVGAGDDTASLNYAATTSLAGTITSADDNTLAAVLTLPATASAESLGNSNVIIDTVAPTFVSASAISTGIVITTSETLAGTPNPGDFTVPGKNVQASILSSGTNISLAFSVFYDDDLTVSYGGTSITDLAGNPLTQFSAQTVTNNLPRPPAVTEVTTLASAQGYREGEGIPVIVRFSESVDTTGTPQLTLNIGGTLVPVDIDRGSGTTDLVFRYVVAPGHNTDNFNYAGTDSLGLNGGTIVATTGGAEADLMLPSPTSSALAGIGIIVDTTAPAAVISSTTADNGGATNAQTISYTADFGEDVTGFVIGDITVTGTANGGTLAASNFAGSGATYTFDVDVTSDGTVIVSIPTSSGVDAAGNTITASNTYTVTIDTTGLTVALTSDTAADSTTNSATVSYTATFSETVTDFVIGDITVSGTANGGTLAASNFAGSGTTYTFDVVTNSDGTVIVSIPVGSATDAATNTNTASNTYTVTIDTAAPTFTSAGTASSTTIDIITSESLAGTATASDFTVPSNTVSAAAISDTTITLTVDTEIVFGGTVTVSYTGTTITDAAGNALVQFSGQTVTNNVPAAPSVSSVTSSGGPYKEADEFEITVTFSESVTVTGTPMLTLETGSTDGMADYLSGSPGTALVFNYTVAAGDNSADLNYVATNSLALNGGTIVTTVGSESVVLTLPATTSNLSLGGSNVIIDTVVPTVVLSSATADAGLTNSNVISYTATFSETVTGFDSSDITLSGTATATVAAPTGGGTTYSFAVTATTDGTVIVSIPADAAQDAATNGNTVSNSYTVTTDITAPTFTSAGTASPITIDIITSESLIGTATASDFTIPGNTVSAAAISDSTITLTVSTDIDSTDSLTVSYAGTTITDAAGNALVAFSGQTVTNNVLPVATVTMVSGIDGDYRLGEGIPITVTFSEDITVTGTPQLVVNVGGTDVPVNLDRSTSTTLVFRYEVAAGHNTADFNYAGTNSLVLNGGSIVTDSNSGAADLRLPATTSDLSLAGNDITIDTTAPTPSISSSIANDGGATNARTISYTVDFGEDVTNFVLGDITVSGTADSSSPAASNFAGSGATYTFDVVTTTDGTVIVSIPVNVATDAAGNQNTVSETYTVTIDTAALTIAITSTTAADSATNSATVSYTATFGKAVTDFVIGDITVTGTANGGTLAASNLGGSGAAYTFDVVTTSDGTVIVSIPTGSATDAATNTNTASNTYTVTIDTAAPTFTSAGTASSTTIDIITSESLAGTATASDFTVPGNTVSAAAISDSTVTITVDTVIVFGGTVTVSYTGSTITDVAGNALVQFSDQTVTNNVPSGPSVSSVTASGGPYKEADEFEITVTFSESVTVTGTPMLTLETGITDGMADYLSGSPGTALVFNYTVAAGDNSADLNYVGTDSLTLNGGTIVATTGGATAILTLPGLTSASSLAGSDVVIDTAPPEIVRAIIIGTDTIEVTTDEALVESTVTGTTVTMTIGGITDTNITGVSLVADSNIVITTTSQITSASEIVVTFVGVEDPLGNASTDDYPLTADDKGLLGTDMAVSITDDDLIFVVHDTLPANSVLVDTTSENVNATLDLSNILADADNPTAGAVIPVVFSITHPEITIDLQATTLVTGLSDSNQILLSSLAREYDLSNPVMIRAGVEIGSPDHDITLSNPARINFTGESESEPYYVDSAGTTTKITTVCADDASGTLGITTGECFIDVGSDLIVWTYHFTTFGAFTIPPISVTDSVSVSDLVPDLVVDRFSPPEPPSDPAPQPRRTGGGGNSGLPPDSRVCGASLCSELETLPQPIITNSNATRSNPDTEQDRDSQSLMDQTPETEPAPDVDPEPILDTDPEPQTDPEPKELGMDPEPKELGMDPEPKELGMDPEPKELGMDPEPVDLEMTAEPRVPTDERNILDQIVGWFSSLFG